MIDSSRPRLVGSFIRQRREAAGLSQRALGLLFNPPVTTQFISNLERGVTPLPLNHVPTLTKALHINEGEIMGLLEQEYAAKLTGRLAKIEGFEMSAANGNGHAKSGDSLTMDASDADFMRSLYAAYRQADPKTRHAFTTVCETILNVRTK